uniref:Uncharacterized protein n=1 Tax=Hyaloperonospora arabidopsidis (strain Emoy2) TaxID=559515 RepID=M4BUT1_HYAAE
MGAGITMARLRALPRQVPEHQRLMRLSQNRVVGSNTVAMMYAQGSSSPASERIEDLRLFCWGGCDYLRL